MVGRREGERGENWVKKRQEGGRERGRERREEDERQRGRE